MTDAPSFEQRLARAKFRSWHRGTREADYMVGGFFDRYSPDWDVAEMDWFEAFMEEQDVDIMAWAMGTQPVPTRYQGPMMAALSQLNFVPIAR